VQSLDREDAETPNELISPASDSIVTSHDVRKYLPELSADVLGNLADDYVLFFWAYTACFEVRPPDPSTFTEHHSVGDNAHNCRPTLHNASGEQIGIGGRMNGPHWASVQGGFRSSMQEFVAIGIRDVYEIPEFPVQMLALQIERVEGVAYRTNIAEINKDAWVAASPKRCLIALE
jgi:hypothetical protein